MTSLQTRIRRPSRALSLFRKSCAAKIASFALGLLMLTAGPVVTAGSWTPLQLSLSPKVQLVRPDTAVRGLRLGLPWSENAEVSGLDLGFYKTPADGLALQCGGLNAQSSDAGGVSLGIVGNVGSFRGIQLSGLFAMSGWKGCEPAEIGGIQFAGGFTEAGAVSGAQIAGIFSSASRLTGIQVAGWTVASDEVSGVQVSGLSCGASRVAGWQLSASVAYARSLQGIQVSGLTNVAEDMADGGLQLSAINLVRCGRGVQLGIVNASEDFNGVQIGLLNIIKNGPIPVMPILNVGWNGRVDGAATVQPRELDNGKFITTSIQIPVMAGVIGLFALLSAHSLTESTGHLFDDWF